MPPWNFLFISNVNYLSILPLVWEGECFLDVQYTSTPLEGVARLWGLCECELSESWVGDKQDQQPAQSYNCKKAIESVFQCERRCDSVAFFSESKHNLYYRGVILPLTQWGEIFFYLKMTVETLKCETEPYFFPHKGNEIVLILGLWYVQDCNSTLLEHKKEGIRMITLNRFRTRALLEFTNLKQSAETADACKEIRLHLGKWSREQKQINHSASFSQANYQRRFLKNEWIRDLTIKPQMFIQVHQWYKVDITRLMRNEHKIFYILKKA